MVPSQITITAPQGPDIVSTARVIRNVQSFTVNVLNGILTVISSENNGNAEFYDISGISTFTVTVASGVYTIVIS